VAGEVTNALRQPREGRRKGLKKDAEAKEMNYGSD
jgi:hypothetical protein